MKVGVYSPYLDVFGGGERYLFTVIEYFLSKGDGVDIFWDGQINFEEINNRFDIDISRARIVKNIFSKNANYLDKIQKSYIYDLIFFLSDGSVPFTLAQKNILHFQTPFNNLRYDNLLNKIKFARISKVICNSYFTQKFIDRSFGIESAVLYPPVDVKKFNKDRKEKIILSVGRFFAPSHPKKQEVMIEAFKLMVNRGIKDWQLILIGGVAGRSIREIENLEENSFNYPIKIITDSSFSLLKNYYGKAMIYWHAAGFGEDIEKFPEKAEHFGITTVEAMAAGCTPIVFEGGGQKEIIEEGKTGFFWKSIDELVNKTERVINDQNLRETTSLNAQTRSLDFSKEEFFKNLEKLI